MTDFENAAYSVFVILLARAILAMGLNFYTPLSYVEENMRRAESIDAVMAEKFWVNRKAFLSSTTSSTVDFERDVLATEISGSDLVELSVDEIINGDGGSKKGLVDRVLEYLDALECDNGTRSVLIEYLDLLRKRASGELPTTAQWIRNFVKIHPNQPYGECSINAHVADDLLQACHDIGMGVRDSGDLNGVSLSSRKAPFGGNESGMTGRSVYLNKIPGTYIPVSICSNTSVDSAPQSVCGGPSDCFDGEA